VLIPPDLDPLDPKDTPATSSILALKSDPEFAEQCQKATVLAIHGYHEAVETQLREEVTKLPTQFHSVPFHEYIQANAPVSTIKAATERLLWHQRLGHPSDYYLFNAHRHADGVPRFPHMDHVLDSSIWLGKTAAVFDWSCLGIFTGSRSGEYAQTVAKHNKFACVPNSWAALPQWHNTPIAFLAADFSFYDKHLRLVHISLLLDLSTLDPLNVHARFRFDKSSTNFTIHKHKQGQGFLCLVRAARSILRRAATLNVPAGNLVGTFHTHPSGSFIYLQSTDIRKVMRMSVDIA